MIGRICVHEGCERPTLKRDLCGPHYERGRHRHRPLSLSRAIRQRARHRATATLIEAHREEYDRLYAAEVQDATTEAAALGDAVGSPGAVVQLRSGPRPAGVTLDERIREVGSCPHCQAHHDAGHRCPRCGAAPGDVLDAEADARRLDAVRRMVCIRCGLDARARHAACRPPGRSFPAHDYRLAPR